MTEKMKSDQRSHVGYGSSYRKGNSQDMGVESGIDAVLGGQVWMVKPDKQAQAANPCLWMQAGLRTAIILGTAHPVNMTWACRRRWSKASRLVGRMP